METQQTPTRRARVDDIITLAARIWEIDRAAILSKSRIIKTVRVRQAVFMVAREHGHSYPHIGMRCGGRDHTTVIHGDRKSCDMVTRDADFAEKVGRLRRQAREAEAFINDRGCQLELMVPIPHPVPPTKPTGVPKKARNIIDANDAGQTYEGYKFGYNPRAKPGFVDRLWREIHMMQRRQVALARKQERAL